MKLKMQFLRGNKHGYVYPNQWNILDAEKDVGPLAGTDDKDFAKLITAAPDLLEALIHTADVLYTIERQSGLHWAALNDARKAITKATGKKYSPK